MKRLTITYGDLTLVDEDVEAISWADEPNGVTVTGKRPKQQGVGGGLGGLLGQLSAGSRRQTAELIATKRAEAEEISEVVDG